MVGEENMLIPHIPFFGLDSKQIDLKWVEKGYGLEANILMGHLYLITHIQKGFLISCLLFKPLIHPVNAAFSY